MAIEHSNRLNLVSRGKPPVQPFAVSVPVNRAAIYARKSTDDSDRNIENKSVTRQVDRARAYAEAKGWQVSDEHIYVDDGISGAEYKRRPGLLRMLNHLKQFDVVLMSELSRLGREQTQNAHFLAEIYGKGRKVFFYLTDEELRFKTAVEKFMVGAVSFGAELEREKASQRSRDALERKASKGFNAGGACFGYDNVKVMTTNAQNEQVKSHTDYKINNEQAGTVRAIFRAYADGHGHTTIAKALNGNGLDFGPKGKRRRVLRRDLELIRKRYFDTCNTTSAKRGNRGTGSWAPSAIREILYRERYTGVVPFGTTKTQRPDLRIVTDELWQRVQQRLKEIRAAYIRDGGHWWGKPSTEKYLLSGMGKCASCGKSLSALGGYSGSKTRKRVYYYGCSYYQTRGQTVCDNDHRAHMEWLDTAVIDAISQQVLTPAAIADTIEKASKLVAQELKLNPAKPRELEREAKAIQKELDRFVLAIADGTAPESVIREIRRREDRMKELDGKLATLRAPLPDLSIGEVRAMCSARLERFRALLLGDVPVARQALRKLLLEPLRITPAMSGGRRTLAFEGRTTLGPLVDPTYKGMASRRGFEPRLPP